MNFLAKFGAALLRVVEIVSGLQSFGVIPSTGPAAVVENWLMKAIKVITDVEAVGQVTGLSGEQMLAAEIPLMSQVVLDALKDTKASIKDEALYKDGIAELTNGLVKVLKSFDSSAVSTAKLG